MFRAETRLIDAHALERAVAERTQTVLPISSEDLSPETVSDWLLGRLPETHARQHVGDLHVDVPAEIPADWPADLRAICRAVAPHGIDVLRIVFADPPGRIRM